MQLTSFENLLLAFNKAKKLKGIKKDILEFEYNLEHNLFKLQKELASGTYQCGEHHSFTVKDPKEREVKAAPFRDRVVHHAICNLIEPIFDRCFVHDSYACRKGKGIHNALKRLKKFLQSIHTASYFRERERERVRSFRGLFRADLLPEMRHPEIFRFN